MSEKKLYWKSSEDMGEIQDECVQTTITSPPYFDLKDYGHEDEIGSADSSYDEFLTRLRHVWNECYTKLTEGGTLWVVANTVMAEDGGIRLLPQDIADDATSVGFSHIETIVWYKPTSLARMNPNLLANKKEYIMLFSKGDSPKLEPTVSSENGKEDPAISNYTTLGDLWRFPVKRGSLGGNVLHKAPFPKGLVKRMVRLATDPGDTVLDPFLGSGTTAEAALELDRSIYGYEINEEFEPIVNERIDDIDNYTQERLNNT